MKQRMKILIAYDGSSCADAALDELRRAGLPRQAEATIVSVTERWLLLPASYGMVETNFKDRAPGSLEEAHRLAKQASERLQASFPDWEVRAVGDVGSPARTVIEKAGAWPADLIVVGSHGRSALGRFILGSVSQKVMTEAACSVRVARGHAVKDQTPVRMVIGIDGSSGAEAAVRAVAARVWPRGSEVRLLAADYTIPPMVADHLVGPLATWIEEERAKVREMQKTATKELRAAWLIVSAAVKEGDPKHLLCNEAESWRADAIFVGARGLGRLERFMLGSVSAAVAARAHCSVEVVRSKRTTL